MVKYRGGKARVTLASLIHFSYPTGQNKVFFLLSGYWKVKINKNVLLSEVTFSFVSLSLYGGLKPETFQILIFELPYSHTSKYSSVKERAMLLYFCVKQNINRSNFAHTKTKLN